MLEKSLSARTLTLRLTVAFRLNQFRRQHPRAGVLAALLAFLGTGVTAFAVAPLTVVNPAPVPTRLITEDIELRPQVAPQLEALATHSLHLHRVDTVRNGDTADSLLRRLGISDDEAARFLRTKAMARALLEGGRGRQVRARSASGAAGLARLEELVLLKPASGAQAESHFSRLRIVRKDGAFMALEETAPLVKELRFAAGVVQTTLFAAADAAHLPEAVTEQMAEVLANDIDFEHELRRGDRFSVVYETMTADGEVVPWEQGIGRVVATRFTVGNSTHEAMWFEEDGKSGAYYDLDGHSKARSFLASPLAFSRVTSGFSMRLHPIHQVWKAHLGVDYAAPTGTVVRAIGDGVVDYSGWQNGYGNVVQVRHDATRSTVYAHLSAIHVKLGQKVAQGATLGAVGATGWATGPHLHFEFKVDGHQVDPVTVARASGSKALSPAARVQFAALADTFEQQLAAAQRVDRRVARME